jgi:hypothetical protein
MQRPIRSAFFLVGMLCALSTLALTRRARARVETDSAYTKAQTYSGALRYLRAELGYEIVEKDPDAAYLIFKYREPGQKDRDSNGTIEIIEASGKVRVFVQLPRMPEYHERVLSDGLMKKLRDEYGTPPARLKNPDSKRPSDAGAD